MNPFEYIKQRITDIADVNVAINGRDPSWGYADLMELLANIEEAYNDRYGSSDTISRQAAIDVLSLGKEILSRALDDMDVVGTEREKYSWGLKLIESNIEDMKELSSAQPEPQSRIEKELHGLTPKQQYNFLDNLMHKKPVGWNNTALYVIAWLNDEED